LSASFEVSNEQAKPNKVVRTNTSGKTVLELGPRTVLVVDDEAHILRAISRLLSTSEDYDVITANGGEEAMEKLREHDVAVLMSDQRMPSVTGAELLKHARENYPHTVRIMITGNNDISTAIEAINQGEVFRFITKPWNNDDLRRVVDIALEQNQLLVSKELYEDHIEAQNAELTVLNSELRSLNEDLERRVEERTREVVSQAKKIEQLYLDLEHSFDKTIQALLSTMELGNLSISKHCQRTARRTAQLSRAIGLDPEYSRHLERAALLHWIGLVNAPEEMFQKPVAEFDPMQMATWEFHPVLGQQAIKHITTLEPASEIILHYLRDFCHETFQPGVEDENLDAPPSEDLVIACRMLRVCSAFEQVRTVRQHRGDTETWVTFEEGLAELEAGRGETFDPELVDTFIGIVSKEILGSSREEIEKGLGDLEPGMVLSRPLETEQGIPVAPRDMVITADLIDRLEHFQATNGLKPIYVWE
jgi:response regulator RpfG family c-di-GMP phosphodiesterase